MKYIDYREKLGLGFCDEERKKIFLNKAYNALIAIEENDDSIDEPTYKQFCYLAGVKRDLQYRGVIGDFGHIKQTLCSHMEKINDFVYYYCVFINSIVENNNATYKRVTVIDWFKQWATESGLEFDFYFDKDGYFIFPKGAKELDDALVSEPLEWLSVYPTSRSAFVKALKEYSEQTDENASEIADKFRKALESFFQEFFKSGKSLENYKTEYGDYLKSKDVPAELSGNFQKLLESYTNFINGYAKHHDKTSRNVLEYIMYQTGNIIRLLITLKQGET